MFYVGSYTRLGGPGVGLCECGRDGLRLVGAFSGVDDPIWVLPGREKGELYAACDEKGADRGMAARLKWTGSRFEMTSVQPTLGRACCHLALDGNVLYAANYLDASVTVFSVENGGTLRRTQHIVHEGAGPDPARQEAAHVHHAALRPGARKQLFVCDLGMDRIFVYDTDENGLLREAGRIPAPAGSGPRHLIFSGPDDFYLACEMGSLLCRYARREGEWRLLQTLSTLPEGFAGENTAAAIRMDETHVYVSNRGHDSIAVFEKDGPCICAKPVFVPVPGRTPRDFILTREGFLVAHQDAGGVALIDRKGGVLASLPMPGAVCVCQANL